MVNRFVAILIVVIVTSAGVSLGAVTGYFGALGQGPSRMDMFAQCLTQKGVTVYTMEGCEHCRENKLLFGSSFKYLHSVDCVYSLKECSDTDIRNVPTWIVGGERYEGVQTPEKLSELTGCPL